MRSVRESIRRVIGNGFVPAHVLVARCGLPHKVVSTALSAMVHRTKELEYRKLPGMKAGQYKLLNPKPTITCASLKLAQLRSLREDLRKVGLTHIDAIINDYEILTNSD